MNICRSMAPLDRMIWAVLLAMLLACGFSGWTQGFVVAPARAMLPLAGCLALAALWGAARRRMQPRLAAVACAFLQMTLFTVLGVVLAYVLAAPAGPLWDIQLEAADRALGFDWPALWASLDRHPVTILVLAAAYHSLVLQMIVAIVALSDAGRLERLRVMVAAAILSGFVTCLISGLIPALGNLFDPARYAHLWPSIAWLERDLIAGLRDGSLRTLDLSALMGIVSFPSYHATLAAIFLWSCRDLPRGSVPVGLWATLTILGTPVFGGHYGVDVLAGLLLAPPALAIAGLFARPSAMALRAPNKAAADSDLAGVAAPGSC